MGSAGSKSDKDGPEPGDLIEIFRPGYEHWAIYVGDGYVIHLAPSCEFAGAGFASFMSVVDDKAWVKKELLREVVGDNRYRVNNKHDDKYSPLPVAKIIQEAERTVGQKRQYSVASANCEHFVTELRYGMPRSDQVRNAMIKGGAGLGLLTLGATTAFIAMKNKRQRDREEYE